MATYQLPMMLDVTLGISLLLDQIDAFEESCHDV